jgi:hypothetical protein
VTGTLVGSTGSGAAGGSGGSNVDIVAFPQTALRVDGTSSNPTGASKLRVGPSFLAAAYRAGFRNLFGPYWIVDAGAQGRSNGIFGGHRSGFESHCVSVHSWHVEGRCDMGSR